MGGMGEKKMNFVDAINIALHSLRSSGAAGFKNLTRAYKNLHEEPLEMSSYPLIIQIEPTLHCNLECRMCVSPISTREKRHMRLDEFKRAVDGMPFLRKISLVGAGEPLLNPDIFDMISYAKSKGLLIGFATNGMSLTNDIAEKIIETRVDWINISIDSADKTRYETIRNGADFNVLLRNVK